MATVEQQFDAAVKVIQSLPKHGGTFQPSTSMRLTFYALYKQGSQGVCNTSRPAFYDVVGRAKWDAWKQLGNMTADEAMRGYVNELKKIVETMPQTDVVQDFLEKLGMFYEMVDYDEPAANAGRAFHDIGRLSGNGCGASTPVLDPKEVVKESNKLNGVYLSNSSRVGKTPAERLSNGSVRGRGLSDVLPETERDLEVDVPAEEMIAEDRVSKQTMSFEYLDDDDDDNDDVDEEYDVSSSSEDNENVGRDDVKRQTEHDAGTIELCDVRDEEDDEEFCDTSDVLFSSKDKSRQIIPHQSDASVQTRNEGVEFRQVESDGKTDEKIYFKIHKAMEEMQKNIEEVQIQLRKLEELNSRKASICSILDVFRRFNVPTLCFVIFWPIAVNVLFRHFSRSKRKSL